MFQLLFSITSCIYVYKFSWSASVHDATISVIEKRVVLIAVIRRAPHEFKIACLEVMIKLSFYLCIRIIYLLFLICCCGYYYFLISLVKCTINGCFAGYHGAIPSRLQSILRGIRKQRHGRTQLPQDRDSKGQDLHHQPEGSPLILIVPTNKASFWNSYYPYPFRGKLPSTTASIANHTTRCTHL